MEDSRVTVYGNEDLWEGTYRDKDVYAMSFNNTVGEDDSVKFASGIACLRRSWISLDAAVVRRPDPFAEKNQPSEHSPFHWHDNGSFPNCCGAGIG